MTNQQLSQTQLDQFKNQLLQELKTVETRIQELNSQDPFQDPEHTNDNASNDKDASEEEGHDRISAQLDELTTQKQAIESSLERINAGTYGICDNCGNPIEEGRLSAYPTATRCTNCMNV